MDRRERSSDPNTAYLAMLDGFQSTLWTTLPAFVIDWDPSKQTATVQVALLFKMQQPDGTFQSVQIKPLLDCPIQFPKGGGAALTFPLAAGDEGQVHFSARCIDSWWQSGGIQAQAELRMHSLSDGFFVPGISSVPQVFPDISTTEVQLRNREGTAFFALNPATGEAKIIAPGGLTIVGNIDHDGSQSTTGTVTAAVDVVAGAISLNSHPHGGVTPGTGQSGGPIG